MTPLRKNAEAGRSVVEERRNHSVEIEIQGRSRVVCLGVSYELQPGNDSPRFVSFEVALVWGRGWILGSGPRVRACEKLIERLDKYKGTGDSNRHELSHEFVAIGAALDKDG